MEALWEIECAFDDGKPRIMKLELCPECIIELFYDGHKQRQVATVVLKLSADKSIRQDFSRPCEKRQNLYTGIDWAEQMVSKWLKTIQNTICDVLTAAHDKIVENR